jgi:hypothetical protein
VLGYCRGGGTVSGLLAILWRLATHVKDAWEWYAIVALIFGLPSAGVIAAFVAGEPLDIIILYVMAALAFFSVMLKEVMPFVAALIEQRRASKFRITRNVNGDCCSEHFASAVQYVLFGVENRTGRTITNAKPYLQIVGVANRVLLWSGEEGEAEIDIAPTPDRFHQHAVLILNDSRFGCRFGLAYHPEIYVQPNTPFEVVLLVTGDNIKPATARARITFKPPDDISVELRPAR